MKIFHLVPVRNPSHESTIVRA